MNRSVLIVAMVALFVATAINPAGAVPILDWQPSSSWVQGWDAAPGFTGVKVETFIIPIGTAPTFESPGATNFGGYGGPNDWSANIINPYYLLLTAGTPGDPTYNLHFTGTGSTQDFWIDTLVYDAAGALIFGDRWLWAQGSGNTYGWGGLGSIDGSYNYNRVVPEPGTLLLLGSGLLVLAIAGWRKKCRK